MSYRYLVTKGRLWEPAVVKLIECDWRSYAMFKFLALAAVGAGAAYYWWHEHSHNRNMTANPELDFGE